ncbi:hypothetical protein J2W35_001224 [Variovorax boronicumulans]|uniref:hypothetical protein n=1 Tax=Variovorax boronicumulans TaxID=436515 RepID=UPI00278A301B|nr:hypothetical protein [Variovorax boronicumulans]MDQ0080887.1 hypothetical protein [Variovorax boronicumulans]
MDCSQPSPLSNCSSVGWLLERMETFSSRIGTWITRLEWRAQLRDSDEVQW